MTTDEEYGPRAAAARDGRLSAVGAAAVRAERGPEHATPTLESIIEQNESLRASLESANKADRESIANLRVHIKDRDFQLGQLLRAPIKRGKKARTALRA